MSIIKLLLEKRSAAWQRKEGKDPEGGLNRKGVASYRRENPGSKLKMAVTTKPSKLKKGSKSWKRRKSFCARMSGMKGAMKKPNGKPTRKALALRKWNCESYEPSKRALIEALKKACWKGYEAIGMKKKGGRRVPNCVPVSEENNFKRRIAAIGIGAALGAGLGVSAPHIRDAIPQNSVKTAMTDKVGLMTHSQPASGRAAIGGGFGALAGMIGVRRRRLKEEVVNKGNKGKMTKAMRARRDKCARSKPKGIKPIKGKDNQENAYHRYCTFREFAKHKNK